ncbi:MAG: hypothetical protein J6T04_08705 [Bacteroidales bacterium]|nr:hypothetical protein [Bacteroidales bacterium]
MGRGNKLEIRYNTLDRTYTSSYQILLEDNMWLYKDDAGTAHISDCPCRCVHIEGTKNGVALNPCSPNEKMKIYKGFCYTSLDDALQKIYDYEVNTNKQTVVAHKNYDIVFRLLGNNMYESFIQKRDELLASI